MLTLITAPSVEPLTSTEAKLHAKVDVSADDALFTTLITAVRERCETATSRAICTQTWDLVLDRFPTDPFIELPLPPLQSITHVKYRDTAGALQTWASTNYVVTHATATPPVLNPRQPRGVLSLAYGISWPDTYGQAGDVTIRFVCGYGVAVACPALLKAAMLLDLVKLYANRDAVVKGTIVATLPGGPNDIYGSYRSYATQRLAA